MSTPILCGSVRFVPQQTELAFFVRGFGCALFLYGGMAGNGNSFCFLQQNAFIHRIYVERTQ